ncbi:MAG: lactamase [Dehalococcoidia bacterium]|nr:lactamase [Dehalococcoidia bacterium]
MDITWLGHSCFRVRSRDASVITDPVHKGWGTGKLEANIVTVSHGHGGHNNPGDVEGSPLVLTGPGEYECKDVLIQGIATSHDGERGEGRGRNIVFLLEVEGLFICHLGDIGHVPTSEQVAALGNVDILMVPVGGGSTIDSGKAVETVRLLEPKLVLPMHFHDADQRPDLEPVDRFLRESGVKEVLPQSRLTVTRSSLPQDTQVVLLERRRS